MALTPAQLVAMSFGYLTGADLNRFCPAELLIATYMKDPNSLQNGVNIGISEIIAALNTRYDLSAELQKIGFTAAQATTAVTGGAVSGITITSGGTSYLTPPSVVFSGPGTGAAGTAILSGGQVTGVTITSGGTGYSTAPTVSFSGGGPTVGSGAVLAAAVDNGVVTGVTVTNPGSGYMFPPELVFLGGFPTPPGPLPVACAKGYAVLSGGGIISVVIQSPGRGYISAPTIQVNPTTPVPDTRATMLVKLLSISAIRNILGNAQNISEKMLQDFDDVRRDIYALRNGQLNMPLPAAMKDVRSSSAMIHSKFRTRG